ncbi:type VI secretion system tip protein TssI/VgrG, partial [Escherichia coli]|uniref:type VI secretion system tip protein TssI/VgrG n=1 Tax=Escherichia coli TaxID=562 RepID=UPI00202D0916
IFCDEHGRVRVKFNWDRYNPADQDSSCWIRVAQAWAGTGFGHLAIPRVGQEVIVDFLNGDPDQPIIMGRTYHQENRTPGSLPGTKTQMTIRSKTYMGSGFNELKFDDATGREQVYIHAQKNMDSYGQLEAEYRIGRNMLLEGDLLSVYSRVFADTGENGVMMPVKNPMSGTGLRWKPLRDQIFFLAVEQQLPLNGQNGASDTMLRASASFFNGGKYSDEWHPNGSGWFAQNLYLDAAQYIRQDIQAWTADYRVSWHQKVANGQTIEPYAHVQDNGYRDKGTQGAQLGGVGVRWNIWTGETHYDAWPHKVSLGVEYQHTFKAINQRNGERNNAFLTIGVHW